MQAQFLSWHQTGNLPGVQTDGGNVSEIVAGTTDTVFAFLSYHFPYGANVHDEIYISTDRGISWKDTKNQTPFIGNTLISNSGAFIFGSTPNSFGIDGIFCSTNGGKDWTNTSNVNNVTSLIHGKDHEYVAEAVDTPSFSNYILHSVDDGLTWKRIILPVKYSGSELCYKDSNTLFLLNYNRIFRSSDFGVTWDSVFASKNYFPFFACDNSIVYVQNDSGDVYTSSSGLKGTWVKRQTDLSNNGFTALSMPGAVRREICFSSSGYITQDTGKTWRRSIFDFFGPNSKASCVAFDSSGVYYAGGSDYILRSTDTCKSWTSISLPIADSASNSASNYFFALAAPFGSSLWALFGSDFHHSPDDGSHWNKIIPKGFRSVYSIGNGSDGSLLAGMLDSMNRNVVARTTDEGNTWNFTSPMKPDNNIDFIREAAPGKIVAIDDAGYCHHSEDNGITWKVVQVEYQPTSIYSFSIADSLTFYAGSQGGFSVSHDGGFSWKAVTIQPPTTLVTSIAPTYNGDVLAVFDSTAIMRSADGGKTWIPQNSGFPKNIKVNGLVTDSKQNVYAGTSKGTFIQFAGETAWRGSTSGLTDLNVTSIITRDKNTLFVSCSHSGIFRADNITGAVRYRSNADKKLIIYPNPVVSSSIISYSLAKRQYIKLELVDQLGRVTRLLSNGSEDAGVKTISFFVNDLPIGMYFLRLESDDPEQIEKFTVVR